MKIVKHVLRISMVLCIIVFSGSVSAIAADSISYDIKAAENDNFILYINENGGVAVENKRTGFLHTSNPADALNDPLAVAINKTNLQSQFYMTYSNALGTLTTNNSGLTEIKGQGVIAQVNSHAGSVSRGGLSYELFSNGVVFRYYFDQYGIVIPLRYTLYDDYLLAEVVISELEEQAGFRLIEITLLPYFGAGGPKDDGYILVPDGSGALIHFNNDKARYLAFSSPVYNRDYALTVSKLSSYTESVAMPVFGIKNGSDGLLAVIESGESLAKINALTSGTITSYNAAYPSFVYRDTATYTLLQGNIYASNGSGGDTVSTLLYSPNQPELDSYAVRYYLLDAPELGYEHMADTYRDYLINVKGMTKKTATNDSPLYLSFLGGVYTEKHFLGFKYNTVEKLTGFSDALKILQTLQSGGVDNIVVKYEGMLKGGLGGKIPSKAAIEGSLGTEKEYRELLAYAADNNIEIFPDFDLVNFYKSGNGFSKFRNSVQDIGDSPTYRYRYDLNYYGRYNWSRWNILTPLKVADAFSGLMKNYQRLGLRNIALSSLGNMLYSDFSSASLGINRDSAQVIWEEMFADAMKNYSKVMTTNSFAYTFPYVDYIMEASVVSSKYDLVDEEVPFYQMVLHGYVSMSVPSLNHYEDTRAMFLKAVETGSSLSFVWMANDNDALRQTSYNGYFSANYEMWMQMALDYYLESKYFLDSVSDAEITKHQSIRQNVYQTDFSNGISVIVNYSKADVSINGETVPARNYKVIGG